MLSIYRVDADPVDSTHAQIDSVVMDLLKVATDGSLEAITEDLTLGDPIALRVSYQTPGLSMYYLAQNAISCEK